MLIGPRIAGNPREWREIMGRIETAFKEEITRLAKRQVRTMMAKHVAATRQLKKRVAELQDDVERLKRERAKEISRSKVATAAKSAAQEKPGQVRLSPDLIRKLRKKLNISQPELARLVKVSPAAVGFWETGKSNPRPDKKARIVALRSLGRRDVKRLLAVKERS